jgi:hypothetical protein
MSSKKNVIKALDGETEAEYDKRTREEDPAKKCIHNYDGQDNKREQSCRFCYCIRFNTYINKEYDVYFDDYL